MRKKHSVLLTVLPLVVLGGLVYAGAHLRAPRHPEAITCPLTGQELPCPKCCPLSRQSRVRPEGYTWPAVDGGLAAD